MMNRFQAKSPSAMEERRQFFPCLTKVMQHDAVMPKRPSAAKDVTGRRITVTFPPDDYNQVLKLAKHKKVSASWIVRDAVDRYLTEDIPLFADKERTRP